MFTEEQLKFMRLDLESDFALSKMIEKAKALVEKDGKNFKEELRKFTEGHKKDGA